MPLAITALVGFIVGGVFAIVHLRSGNRKWDAYSYVSIHMSVIFGVAVLITGSIWAKASWGHWWVWDEPTLVSFLIVFLMYATYYPFRYAIEDPERQARYASVFAVTAGAFVPLNFMAVRMAQSLVHPRVFAHHQRRPARLDDVHLPRLPRRDGAALGDAGQARADREEHLGPAQAAAPRPRRAGAGRRRLADRAGGELGGSACSSPRPRRCRSTRPASTSPAPTSSSSS